MKKFLGKFLLLALPLFLFIGTLNFLYTRTNYWKNTINDKFKNVPEGIQLANIGSSHGLRSFDYGNVPHTSFNFGLTSQRFFYDYAILKKYINRFEKNAVLFITISYNQITEGKPNFRSQRARYYRFLEKEYMDFYSAQEKILYTRVPVLTAGATLKFIIKDQKPSARITRVAVEPALTKYCINKHKSWTNSRRANIEAREERFAYNKYWAEKIVELCYARGIQPVLISTPITSILNNIYAEKTPDFFDDFYRFTRELQESYPGLPYFDYSHDPRFENDFSLFRDGDHLNAAGAKKFTAVAISDLEAGGIAIPD